eukprot:jgi/Chlat1/4443/Chrsp29S04406
MRVVVEGRTGLQGGALRLPCSKSTSPVVWRRRAPAVVRKVGGGVVVMAAGVQEVSAWKAAGGWVRRYQHDSSSVACPMKFHVFFPPQADLGKVPVLYYLAGLTCTDETFMQKAGALKKAAQLGLAIVTPDTSPRGHNVEGENDDWDFGVGAGFYLNATVEKWKHWRMYDYVSQELPALLRANMPSLDTNNASIFGHSMGGHGALTLALKNPGTYKSCSAFAAICNPSDCPWGQKAFSGYLGEDRSTWEEYDASLLAAKYTGKPFPILLDQGTADKFLKEDQLKPEVFEERTKIPAKVRMQDSYDHSYYFISTFVDDHLELHAKALHA